MQPQGWKPRTSWPRSWPRTSLPTPYPSRYMEAARRIALAADEDNSVPSLPVALTRIVVTYWRDDLPPTAILTAVRNQFESDSPSPRKAVRRSKSWPMLSQDTGRQMCRPT